MTIGSLFTGIGGLDRGLEMLGLGPVRWQCDADPASREVLATHYPGVWCYRDVKDINERAERVDIICGGFPCQPHSIAGKRKGTSDSRWLWPEFARVIGANRPKIVFIENVPGLRSSGMYHVLADLAGLGFDAAWGLYSAAEVGAPHIRKRLFILAYTDGLRELQQEGFIKDIRGWVGDGGPPSPDAAHANSESLQLQPRGPAGESGQEEVLTEHDGHKGFVANPDRQGLAVGGIQPSRSEFPSLERSSPQTNPWSVEPDVGRVAHGISARVDRLRLLGNACVPLQAAYAFQSLLSKVAP